MRISLNWLKRFVKIGVSDQDLIRLIGARLVEVEGVIDETHKYDNIYIVKVESAEKIPDTHLTLCKINVGDKTNLAKVEYEDGLVQVMCGAPNVRAGMFAVWIAPGAVVPASVHEDAPFVIGKRKMLGKYDSYGMLAGADELDFGDDHTGIVEIDPDDAVCGDGLADVYDLRDIILEIENKSLTHRPDCFGMLGFAREVAGILNEKFDYELPHDNLKIGNGVKIEVRDEGICSRYLAMTLTKHGELKKKYLTWTDTILSKSGMRPVDRIVDATNYLMLLTGQPLHAFDYDKFVAVGGGGEPKIVVRLAHEGEKLTLLDGKEVILNGSDIVITSNNVPVALAGAMGGISTAIDENTRNIILEAAVFSLYNLRKTQMVHGIFSEAITRFTKGQPDYQCATVAEDFASLVSDGFRVTGVNESRAHDKKNAAIRIDVEEINSLLGTKYTEKKIAKTLENVGFVVKVKRERLEIEVPAWRTDIHIKEDIIEEIGRLNGYDNIEPTLPRHRTAERNKLWRLESQVRTYLSDFGANEILTYSFVSEKLLRKVGLDNGNSYKIVNSISPELQFVRQTLTPSLLDKAYVNQKLPIDKFAIFEINKVYQKGWGMDDEGVPTERIHLGLVAAERKGVGAAYYRAKHYAERLLRKLNVKADFVPISEKNAMTLPFEPKRAAMMVVNGVSIGVVGEYKNSVRRNFKLEEYLAGFEMDVETLRCVKQEKRVRDKYVVSGRQDVTITTTQDYAVVLKEIENKYPEAEISPVGIYQADGSREKNITFHLEFH
ncbi:phenylalanine--tRNA ligase subunit beta [Candidatus Saccharibacteria bacterium]|nr:phenylalanine--tRNA ligase subunit beta [Candidatus Saccharibacteria bacterium]